MKSALSLVIAFGVVGTVAMGVDAVQEHKKTTEQRERINRINETLSLHLRPNIPSEPYRSMSKTYEIDAERRDLSSGPE